MGGERKEEIPMHSEERLIKKLRVALVLPLIPLMADAVIQSTVGAHHPQDLIWGPIMLVLMAPLVGYLLRQENTSVSETPVLSKGFRVIRGKGTPWNR